RNRSDLDAPIEENSSHDNTSMSASTESYRGSSASSYGERKNADALIRKPLHHQDNLSMRRPSYSLRGGNSRGAHLNGSPSSVAMPSTSLPNTHSDFEGSLDDSFDPLKVNQGDALGDRKS